MTQTRLHVTATKADALALTKMLEAEFEDDGLPVATFEDNAAQNSWSISIYAPGEAETIVAERMAAVLAEFGLDLPVHREPLVETDWVSRALGELKPVLSGRFIVHGSHDRHVPRPFERAIQIDAAMAFGTGHHGTTAGCLDMLRWCLNRRRFANALDIGTGTGILAIALAKSLPIRVLASDIDPVSVAIARENCRINGVAARVGCIVAAGLNHPAIKRASPFDLVMANILAGPLQAMAHALASGCAPGATVIMSGLLPRQKARIVATYRLQGLVLEHAHHRDGWLTLVLRKPF